MAAKKAAEYNPIRKGSDPRTESSDTLASQWVKIEPGTAIDAVVLVEADEIISVEQCAIWLDEGNSPVWVYTGPEDPTHELKTEKTYRAYLPVLVDGESKVWSMGKTAHRTILDIADAVGDLKGIELRIKRTGSGLTTRYSIVSKGTRKDVSRIKEVDVVAMLGPITPEGVRKMIAEKLNCLDYDEVLERYRGKSIRRPWSEKSPSKEIKGSGKVKVDEDEDEDLDDVELI